MKVITVYCASSNNISDEYINLATLIGSELSKAGFGICYGGGKVGLMGALADGAISAGGNVTGVIPDFMMELELGHTDIHHLIEVGSMHERQNLMLKKADAIIALPGGTGTFAELFEAITWKRLGLVNCPIIIVNINNYYDELIKMLEKAIDEGFMRKTDIELWHTVSNSQQVVSYLYNRFEFFNHFDMA